MCNDLSLRIDHEFGEISHHFLTGTGLEPPLFGRLDFFVFSRGIKLSSGSQAKNLENNLPS